MTFSLPLAALQAATAGSVLVVDDLETNRALMARRLDKFGYSVSLAESGAAALAIIDSELPDVVLLDYMMPHMNGLEVLAKLRSNAKTRNLPVIMVTARAEAEAVVEALEAGVDDYVTKPIDFDVLRARMEKHIEKRLSVDSLARANAALDQRIAIRSMALADMESELQDEIRKRQELEKQLADGPVEIRHIDNDTCLKTLDLVNRTDEMVDELFANAIAGKVCNPAKVIQIRTIISQLKMAVQQANTYRSD
jgi:DNA-binding response OmpR family regulator